MTQDRACATDTALPRETTLQPRGEVWTIIDQAIDASYDMEAMLRIACQASDIEEDTFSQLGGTSVLRMAANNAGKMTEALEQLHNVLFRKREAKA